MGLLVFNLSILLCSLKNVIHSFQVGNILIQYNILKMQEFTKKSVSPPISNLLTPTATPLAATVSNLSCILSGNSVYVRVCVRTHARVYAHTRVCPFTQTVVYYTLFCTLLSPLIICLGDPSILGRRRTDSLGFLCFLIFIIIQLQLYAFSPHPSTP